jgi:methylmalonyl-CoA mutase C-terminal domain/subunit
MHTEFCISYAKFVTQGGSEVKPWRTAKGPQVADKIRVLLAKVGLDGHDRGVRVVARCLRDAGMDVIYTGLHRSPEEVVDAAVQEDVDVLGVSLLSGAHMTAFPRIQKRLKERGVDDIILLGGGVIPDEDVVALKKMGVAEILLQDTPPEAIVETVQRLVRERGPR